MCCSIMHKRHGINATAVMVSKKASLKMAMLTVDTAV